MATSFYGGNFFSGEFFNTPSVADVAVKTGVGGIDPGEGIKKKYPPVKPLGILHLPRRKTETPVEEAVEDRTQDLAADRAEIAARLAREFSEETAQLKPIQSMSMQEIDYEIGVLLRKEQRTREDEILLIILLAASV